MASRAAHPSRAYLAGETEGVGILGSLLHIQRGLTAIIGGGGKSTLLRALAEELSHDARVVVATSTKMYVPDWCPVVLGASPDDVQAALSEAPIVCAGSIHPPTGKLTEPRAAFSGLVCLADYVLVEADGAKKLPLKAHAEHEPVIPACAGRTVCVVGVDGLGAPVSQTCHRPQIFAQLAGVSADDAVTPEAVAAVLCAEALHDVVLINKVETAADWQAARRIAALCDTPVVAGSLWRDDLRCLR